MRLLRQALRGTAPARRILVAADYDGTLAPIVNDPDQAHPDRAALDALAELGEMPDTFVAIISGRSVEVLRSFTGAPASIELIGSHGAERGGASPNVEPGTVEELRQLRDQLVELSDRFPGSRVEEKPSGVAFHYREVTAERRGEADAAARRLADAHSSFGLLAGKRVIEFTGAEVRKGGALCAVRDVRGVDLVVFIGDDITDEDAFSVLRPEDVGIKVGTQPTAARFHVEDQKDVAGILETLLVLRRGVSLPRR
jgi:trehalose 6-phosphate phosphatase